MYITISEEGEESTSTYNLNKIPTGLKKKYRLLESFSSYLMSSESSGLIDETTLESTNYIKFWIRSKHAFAFRFSNKTVQVLFNDNAEIRMTGRPNRIVIYINSQGKKIEENFEKALESEDTTFLKRLEYARKMIKELMSR